jgi:hypothetical protein
VHEIDRKKFVLCLFLSWETFINNAQELDECRGIFPSFGWFRRQYTEPVFVDLLRGPGIDSQPGGPVRQPYFSYRSARLHRLAKSIPRHRFLGSINVYKYGLCIVCGIVDVFVCLHTSQNILPPCGHRLIKEICNGTKVTRHFYREKFESKCDSTVYGLWANMSSVTTFTTKKLEKVEFSTLLAPPTWIKVQRTQPNDKNCTEGKFIVP